MTSVDTETRTAARPGAAGMQALRSGVALAPVLPGDRIDLAGAHRVRFLQNLVTCDVGALAPGRGARGFFTSAKGGVLADVGLAALDDRFRLALPAERGEAIAAHLARYRIADRVEIERRDDLASVGLRGAAAPALLAELGAPAFEPGEHAVLALGGRSCRLARDLRGPEPRFELEASTSELTGVVAALLRAGERYGLVEIGAAELELARIEDGELRWGVDYGEENFPQETGDDDAVSFTKGCYLGQEVVARIQYRGGVQRLPRRLRFEAGAEPSRGAELRFEGRPVGRTASLARDPSSGVVMGLALVHRRASDAATRLTTADGASAVVEKLAPRSS